MSSSALQRATIVANVADHYHKLLRTAGTTYGVGTSGTTNVITGDPNDVLQLGATRGKADIATVIIPFLLPALGAGQSFGSASFSNSANTSQI